MRLSSRVRALFITAIVMLVVTLGLAGTVYAMSGVKKTNIIEGVSIDSVDIGGLTTEEAQKALDQYIEGLKATRVTINIDGRATEVMTLGDLGLSADGSEFIEEAILIGKKGNPIKRYMDVKDVEENGINYEMGFTFDKAAVNRYVSTRAEEFNIPSVSSTIHREAGQFVITDHVVGRKIDVSSNVNKIYDFVTKEWNLKDDMKFDLVAEDDEPEYTSDELSQCTTLLGSFTTDYSPVGTGRAQNVENGARLVNGSVLYPDEILSVDEKLRPYTAANGYGVGGAYLNGEVVDSVGGGICQVSSTLYNAVLLAELEVVERAAHSMTVTYVPLSRDAAIAGDYKDFKFKNSTEYPLMVESFAKGGKITFNLYGYESRDTVNRKIDYKYEVLETKAPGEDIIKEDPEQPEDYEVITQHAFNGYTSVLYKYVYVNGKQTEKTKINVSYYKPSPNYITKGTKKVDKKDKKDKKKVEIEDEDDYDDDDFDDFDDYDDDDFDDFDDDYDDSDFEDEP